MHFSISRALNPRAFHARLAPYRRQFDAKRVPPRRGRRSIRLLTKWLFSGYKLKKSRRIGYSPIMAPWVVSVHDFSHVYLSLRGRQVKSSRIKSLKLVAICFLTCRGNSFSHFLVPSSCVEEVTNVLHFSGAIEMDSFFSTWSFIQVWRSVNFYPTLRQRGGKLLGEGWWRIKNEETSSFNTELKAFTNDMPALDYE